MIHNTKLTEYHFFKDNIDPKSLETQNKKV